MIKMNPFFYLGILFVGIIILSACNSEEVNTEANNEENKDYPEKSIEMIVPFEAGGSTDTTARVLAEVASDYLPNNQDIAVVNKPGGSGAVGFNELYKADSDGYTIGFAPSGPLVSAPLISDTDYTHDSFQPVIQVSSQPQILVVGADAPWDNFDEWLSYVEENPGDFTYSHPGIGLNAHLAMEAVNDEIGIETEDIPYDGAAPARTALLG